MRKRLLTAAAIIGVLAVTLVLGIRLALPPARLRALLEPRLEAALGREVDIGNVTLDWFPLAARLENVRVHANPGFPSPHVVELGALQLELAFLPLWRRQVDVRALVLESPHIVLEQDAAGQWNTARPAAGASTAPARAPSAGTPIALGIRRLTLHDGSLQWKSAPRGLDIEAPLAAELALELDRDRRAEIAGWIESPALAVQGPIGHLPALPVRCEVRLRADLADSSAVVESLRVRVRDLTVDLDGKLALRQGRPQIDLGTRTQELDLAALLALLPRERLPELAQVQVAGTARLDLDVHVAAPDPPRFSGKLELAGGRLQAPKWPAAVEALQARATVHGDSLVVESLDARIADAPFHVEGRVFALGTPARSTYDLVLRSRLDLGTVAAVVASLSPQPLAWDPLESTCRHASLSIL